jgi:hypothetical protein
MPPKVERDEHATNTRPAFRARKVNDKWSKDSEDPLMTAAAQCWWSPDIKEYEAHDRVFKQAARLLAFNIGWRTSNFQWKLSLNDMNGSMFSNPNVLALGAGANFNNDGQGFLTHNVINSCIRGVESQVLKDEPRTRCVTENGNGKLQRQVKKLTQFADGMKDVGQLDVEAKRAAVAGLTCGTGFLYGYNDVAGNVCFRSLWPNDVLVDPFDGINMRPQEMMLRSDLSKPGLIEQYPDKAEEIAIAANSLAGPNITNDSYAAWTTVPNCTVIEAWRLPSSPDAHDGRHVICCSNVTLVDEEWELDFIPIWPIRFAEDLLGFYGIGIAQLLWNIQMLMNDMLNTFVESMHMLVLPRFAVPTNGGIAAQLSTNHPGAILTYDAAFGEAHVINIPQIAPSDFYAFLADQERWAYQVIGLNESSIDATKPAGLNSGVALEEYRDNQQTRLSAFAQRYDQLHVDATRGMIELTRRFSQQNGFSPKVKGRKFLDTIQWKDVALDADAYTVECFATAELPNTPAGRFERIQQLAQIGALSRETLLQLLDVPDVDGVTNRMTAAAQRLDLIITRILDSKGKDYESPDEYLLDPLEQQTVTSVLKQEYNLACCNQEPESTRLAIDAFYKECLSVIQRMLPPPPPVAQQLPAPSGVSPAAAAPLPQNQLLPQSLPAKPQ